MTQRRLYESWKRLVRSFAARETGKLRLMAFAATAGLLLAGSSAQCQVITIDTNGKGPVASSPVSSEYQQIEPTHVQLSRQPLDPKTKLMLIRYLESEQGFAMHPLPRGHKGMTLEANGKLAPAGEAYLNMATRAGISAKPGDRVVITNVKIEQDKISFDLNGGPDVKHRFLSHIQIGMGDPNYGDPNYGDPTQGQPTQPIVPRGETPTGARITLAFHGNVPELTGDQVESLLAPLISFKVQAPIEAYTATLPAPLKTAILNHEVWVGMNDQMVLFAKGRPENKYRESDNNTPVTIWMYGKAPQTVDFVHFNGNRVIKVEIARTGQPLEVFTKDQVTPLLMAGGTSLAAMEKTQPSHPVQEGDVQRDPDTQAPAPPPTLGAPAEKLPGDQPSQGGPVYFPPEKQDSGSGQATQQSPSQPTTQQNSQPDTVGQNPDQQPADTDAQQNQSPDSGRQQPAQSGSRQTPSAQTQPQHVAPGSAAGN